MENQEKNTQSQKATNGIKNAIVRWSAQSWPVLMVILIGIAALFIFVGTIIWKIIGLLVLIYAIKELLRWRAAKKAGEFYCPKRAVVAYIMLIMITIILVISLIAGSSPVSQVQAMEFDEFPNATIGEIIDGSMKNQDWSYETHGDTEYVYVYGAAPDLGYDQIGFEFTYESHGDYYSVTLTDVYAEGNWWGALMAYACLTEFYDNM